MRFLQNKEIVKTLLLELLFLAAATIAAFVWDARFGLFTLVLSLLFVLLHTASTYQRYRHIHTLAADIDRLLHGEDLSVSLDAYREGELAVLQSEIHKMTNRLREQRQELQEDKLYLSDLIADISHQIRTPLTSINLLLSFLAEPDLSEERRAALSHELFHLVSRIDWLITSLLKMSKLDAGTVSFRRETVGADELIRAVVSPLLVPIELREQTLITQASGAFTGDLAWTSEALGNIVKNCMEHTPNGGEIEIAAEENALYSEIRISDNGSGIDMADLPHIFERFYKGKQADENNFGIGLALARTIITAQNGTIKAENKKPTGALFTVRFYKGTV